VCEQSTRISVQETRLAAAEEEKQLMAEDLERRNVNEDEQIRRDMNIRNEAVKEKNMAWIELSQTKVIADHVEGRADVYSCLRKGELLLTSQQLMEVIQQKVT
jgi:hypothetical protein